MEEEEVLGEGGRGGGAGGYVLQNVGTVIMQLIIPKLRDQDVLTRLEQSCWDKHFPQD